MRFGLIGGALSHSFSPELHKRLGGYEYALCELSPRELPAFFEKRDFDGVNVTVPYKQAVLAFLDELDPAAARLGAVNTVVNRNGKLIGYNTDYTGLLASLRRFGPEINGKKVLILGTGGAANVAAAAAQTLGARECFLVSRSGRGGALTYPAACAEHADTEILVNATPVGTYPELDACPIDLACFPQLAGVMDLVYNPLKTRLLLTAQARGVKAVNGLYMLARQAADACALFTGRQIPDAWTDRVYAELLQSKRNLVLIGMPTCGKTTVGRLLAERLHRPFIDVDLALAELTGRGVPELFAALGEQGFRALETELIRSLAGRSGCVIATGGGSVLRDENLSALRHNGELIFLDRPLPQLSPSADRPLSGSRERLEALYAQRYERYLACADLRVPVVGGAEETVERILKSENYL